MNKKGQSGVGRWIFSGIGLFIIVLISALIIYTQGGSSLADKIVNFFVGLGWTGENVFSNIFSFFDFLKDLAVPVSANLNTDQTAIAFAMFLLVWIVGTRALIRAFNGNGILSFFIAGLVSIISSRALTPQIINDYVAGSPIAATVFLAGVIPLFAFYGIIKNWKPTSNVGQRILLKFFVWALFGMTYFVVFFFGFKSGILGISYLVLILLAGITETVIPYYKYYKLAEQAKTTGQTMAQLRNILRKADNTTKAFNESEFSDLGTSI